MSVLMEVEYLAQLVAKRILQRESVELLTSNTVAYPASIVHRLKFAVEREPVTLYVKCPRESGSKYEILAERLRREFDVTQKVHRTFPASSELAIVSPAGFLKEVSGLVTWEVRGEALQKVINDGLRFHFWGASLHLRRLCGLSGQWLRQFHNLDLLETGVDPRPSLKQYFQDRLLALRYAAGSGVTKALTDSLSARLDTWMDEAIGATGARIILCHDDFSPHNIFVTGKQLTVLDFSFSEPGFPAFDLTCFWHKLEDLRFALPHFRRPIRQLQACFLSSYGDTLDLARPEVKLGAARLVLAKMITLLRERHRRPDEWICARQRYRHYLALLNSEFGVKRT